MSDYTAWRITYQDAEKAAQAAFKRMCELEADVKFWAGAAEEATLKLTARAETAEAEVERLKGLLDAYCGPGSSHLMSKADLYPSHFAGKPRTFAEKVNTAGEVPYHWFAEVTKHAEQLSDEQMAELIEQAKVVAYKDIPIEWDAP